MQSRGSTRRRVLRVGASALVLAVLGISGTELRRHTEPFTDDAGRALPDSVASIERIALNDSVQEVWIRGADRRKPLLVLLHGGPGASESALFRHYVPGLEQNFVVVYWDQRGTGRSLLPRSRPEALSTEQLLRSQRIA